MILNYNITFKLFKMEQLIIKKAIDLMKSDFMQYPDYDESIEISLLDAITVLLSQSITDIDTCEIYDFLTTKFKE